MSQSQTEYVGWMKFPATVYDLDSIPDNETAARAAAEIMPLLRMSAVFLTKSDDELEAAMRAAGEDDESLEDCVSMVENLGAAIDLRQQELDLLQAGFVRLTVIVERIIGEDELNYGGAS